MLVAGAGAGAVAGLAGADVAEGGRLSSAGLCVSGLMLRPCFGGSWPGKYKGPVWPQADNNDAASMMAEQRIIAALIGPLPIEKPWPRIVPASPAAVSQRERQSQ
jgi:hypothetical protein